MIIKRRIKLKDCNYYISIICEYKKLEDGYVNLELKNYKDKYIDLGDLSNLIKKIEANYNSSNYRKYDEKLLFMSDCLYIYDNIPFISGVGDYTVSKDGVIDLLSYISKEELDDYIKMNNVNMSCKDEFKLWDERTWGL